MERFLEYWQACKQQEILHALTASQLQSICHSISRSECNSGIIRQPEIIADLGNSLIGVIPQYAARSNQWFIPYILLAHLDVQGILRPKAYLSLPIIPNAVLEPASLCPITLGAAEQFADQLAVNPPQWSDADEAQDPTWQQQLEYAAQLLNDANDHWQQDLSNLQYTIQEQVLVFSVSKITQTECNKLQDLDLSIVDKPKLITLVDAQPGSNSHDYSRNMVLNAWINAAIKQLDPPRYVWLQQQQSNNKFATIFSCFEVDPNAQFAADPVHAELLQTYDSYLQGKQVLRNCEEIQKRIIEKYEDKGGIEARIVQLHNAYKDAKAQFRHLEVLTSIWDRQKELLVGWAKMFDFVPMVQKNRLARLHMFFKQNFPQEDVSGFTQEQFDGLVADKRRRAVTTLRMVADALHQVENDKHQEQIIREKCLQWAKDQYLTLEDLDAIKLHLEQKIWNRVAVLALNYWQQDFSAKCGYNDFCTAEPQNIEQLIIEHAQYVSPMQATQLLAKTKRVTVIGNYSPILAPRFNVAIDYELTKHYGLTENDADFEDLQFDGILGSVGNAWNMLSKDAEADEILPLIDKDMSYQFIDIAFASKSYCGSLINQGSMDLVLAWLNENSDLRKSVTIYTCFAAQAYILRNALKDTIFSQVPVRQIQEVNQTCSKISIFLPVYAMPDRAPFVFDKGTEMFDQLLANTTNKIIIIGDKRLFKPELHSASGNFAKLFSQNTYNNKTLILEEVDCV